MQSKPALVAQLDTHPIVDQKVTDLIPTGSCIILL